MEMLLSICKFSADMSLKTIRLTSKSLANAASPWLFQEVWLTAFPDSLLKFHNISCHPILGKYVKILVYEGELLTQYDTMEEWEKRLDYRGDYYDWYCINKPWEKGGRNMYSTPDGATLEQREEFRAEHRRLRKIFDSIPRHDLSDEQLQEHYEMYRFCYDYQQLLLAGSITFRFLAMIFRGLPNLRKVSVRSEYGFRSPRAERPYWRHLKKFILVGPDESVSTWSPTQDGVRQALSILYACEISKRGISSLSLDLPKPDFWSELDTHDAIAIQSMGHKLSFAFEHLKSLRLRIGYDSVEQVQTRTLMHSLAGCVRRCRQLESLDLCVDRDLESENPRNEYDFLKHFASVSLPRLQDLKLTLSTREKSLMRFLKRHSSTLRMLWLLDVELPTAIDGGLWRSIIIELPYILKLETVYLESLLDSEYTAYSQLFESEYTELIHLGYRKGSESGKAIRNYILHGGEFPGLEPPVDDP